MSNKPDLLKRKNDTLKQFTSSLTWNQKTDFQPLSKKESQGLPKGINQSSPFFVAASAGEFKDILSCDKLELPFLEEYLLIEQFFTTTPTLPAYPLIKKRVNLEKNDIISTETSSNP